MGIYRVHYRVVGGPRSPSSLTNPNRNLGHSQGSTLARTDQDGSTATVSSKASPRIFIWVLSLWGLGFRVLSLSLWDLGFAQCSC